MVGEVMRYTCDACRKQVCVAVGEELKGWTKTEIGDLCPSCSRSWVNYKESFLERMRKDNGTAIV